MGCQIAAQTRDNDEFFAFICSLDEEDLIDDRFLEDETVWEKANPSIAAGIPGLDYIRAQVREARGLPSKMSIVKRLNFCVWTEADDPWISRDVWMGAQDDDFDEDLLIGRRCHAGLDLSSVLDLTSLPLLFYPTDDDPFYRLKVHFWIPDHELQQRIDRDRVPYDDWRDRGFLRTLPGRAIDKAMVLRDIVGVSERYNLQGIAYDRWRIEDLVQLAENNGVDLSPGKWDKDKREWKFPDGGGGIRMLPFGQEHKSMSPAVDKFETMLVNGQIRVIQNPVLTWNAANAVVTKDPDENRKVSKSKSIGRVDGIVAAVMACGVIDDVESPGSAYEGKSAEEIRKSMCF
jgi:phage terminase large subunit-like protein